jgi:hypothetical protein
MEKGNYVLFELALAPEFGKSLDKISVMKKEHLEWTDIRHFDQNAFGPFEKETDAFLSLGKLYRFVRRKDYDIFEDCIVNKDGSKKYEYVIWNYKMGDLKPVKNLKRIIDNYMSLACPGEKMEI